MKKLLSKFSSVVLLLAIFFSVFASEVSYAYDHPYDGINTVSRNFAIKNDGTLWGWGTNDLGQIGNGTTKPQNVPMKIMTNVSAITQDDFYTLALKKDSSLWTWGSNQYGQLGNGGKGNATHKEDSYIYKIQTTPIKLADNVSKIYTDGEGLTLYLKKDGSLWACGYDLGNIIYNSKVKDAGIQKTPIKLIDNVASLQVQNHAVFVIKRDSSLWFWGKDPYNIVCGGADELVKKPTKIMDNVSSFKIKLSPGFETVAILKKDGSLWACGENTWGEVGNGTNKIRIKPMRILDNVVDYSLSAPPSWACMAAIKKDGSLWMWGSNKYGQIGNGGVGNAKDFEGAVKQTKPVKVLENVSSVSIDATNQIIAVKKDHTLWIWGTNLAKTELGTESGIEQFTPVKLMDDVVSVYRGLSTPMVLKSDKSLWSWGGNLYGSVGDGTLSDRNTPVQVLDNVKAVFGEVSAIKTDGTLWRWGYVPCDSLGNGTQGNGTVSGRNGIIDYVQNIPVPILNNVMCNTK